MQKLRLELEAEFRGARSGARDLRHSSSDAFDASYDKEGENEREKDQVLPRSWHLVAWFPGSWSWYLTVTGSAQRLASTARSLGMAA